MNHDDQHDLPQDVSMLPLVAAFSLICMAAGGVITTLALYISGLIA